MTEPVFTHDWFSRHIPTWEQHLAHLPGTPCQILEVGSYEGRSACWMLDHLMGHYHAQLICIDAGIGVGHEGSLTRLKSNLEHHPRRMQVSLYQSSSFLFLPGLSHSQYDLIYLDGSHLGGDLIRDLCNAWPLLKPGGILIVDDYQFEEPGVEPREWAGPAIDYWLTLRGPEVEVLHQGYQVIVRRK